MGKFLEVAAGWPYKKDGEIKCYNMKWKDLDAFLNQLLANPETRVTLFPNKFKTEERHPAVLLKMELPDGQEPDKSEPLPKDSGELF